MIEPRPPHWPHGRLIEKKPWLSFCMPEPSHTPHFVGVEPGAEPAPLLVGAPIAGRNRARLFADPVTAAIGAHTGFYRAVDRFATIEPVAQKIVQRDLPHPGRGPAVQDQLLYIIGQRLKRRLRIQAELVLQLHDSLCKR